MRVWIASFLVLFGIAELYQWAKHLTLPLPVYVLGGAFLAIASNYDKIPGFPFQRSNEQTAAIKDSTPPVIPEPNAASFSPLAQSQSKLDDRSISFKIDRLGE
jgi:hypothetical protein